MFLNQLTGQKERIESRKQELPKEKTSKEEISDTIYKETTEPCKRLKLMLASRNTQNLPTDFLDDERVSRIRQLFSTYGSNFKFKNGSIYYYCKADPINHLKTYYKMAKLCEQAGYKSFMCFPLRKTYISCYMTIDTMILNSHIVLNSYRSKLDKKLI
jgi:hypothetical protein